jgi:hypothetical protein
MEPDERKSSHVLMPRCHHWRSVLSPTPERKQKDDSIMLGSPQLIVEPLNGQWRISSERLLNHIGLPVFSDGLVLWPEDRWITNVNGVLISHRQLSEKLVKLLQKRGRRYACSLKLEDEWDSVGLERFD